jgi:hypothetical protein
MKSMSRASAKIQGAQGGGSMDFNLPGNSNEATSSRSERRLKQKIKGGKDKN